MLSRQGFVSFETLLECRFGGIQMVLVEIEVALEILGLRLVLVSRQSVLAADLPDLPQGGAGLGQVTTLPLRDGELQEGVRQVGVPWFEKAPAHVGNLLVESLGLGILLPSEESIGEVAPCKKSVGMFFPKR